MTSIKIKILFLFILFSHALHLKATVHEEFSKFICDIIGTSRNVKESHYDNQTQIVVYQTIQEKECKVVCLWYPKNEKKRISIDESDWKKIYIADYIMIGYGQSPNNPAFYYFVPTKKIKKEFDLKKMEKYLLSFPITYHYF